MGLFKSKQEKELDQIILCLEMNMSNNYKDNAQADLKELIAKLDSFRQEGTMKSDKIKKYEDIVFSYQTKMKGYSHKDQKPYWT